MALKSYMLNRDLHVFITIMLNYDVTLSAFFGGQYQQADSLP